MRFLLTVRTSTPALVVDRTTAKKVSSQKVVADYREARYGHDAPDVRSYSIASEITKNGARTLLSIF